MSALKISSFIVLFVTLALSLPHGVLLNLWYDLPEEMQKTGLGVFVRENVLGLLHHDWSKAQGLIHAAAWAILFWKLIYPIISRNHLRWKKENPGVRLVSVTN